MKENDKYNLLYLLLLSNIMGISAFFTKITVGKDNVYRENLKEKEERRESEQKIINLEEKKEELLERKQEKLKPLVWRFP
ncbi:hypothetical protein [Thermovenabulum sp.]|uniref:hypothetical protein n=1 Tax=Thermovenabulum sp. TaxID=3100335 RepID=UPI003C7AE458